MNSGLSYSLAYAESGSVQLSGSLAGEVETEGISRLSFDPNQTGPVGIFVNSHDVGGPRSAEPRPSMG